MRIWPHSLEARGQVGINQKRCANRGKNANIYMLSIHSIKMMDNLLWDEVEIRSEALGEFLRTGKVSAEIVCTNEYGARFTAAKCRVCGDTLELLSLCKEANKSEVEYITYPIDMFKVI